MSNVGNILSLQNHWEDFIDASGANFFLLKTWGTMVLGGMLYFGLGAAFAYFDFTQKPEFIRYILF